MALTTEEYTGKLKTLQNEFKDIILNAPFFASNDLQGKLLQRIFVLGKATNGGDIGQYKPGPYKAKRNENGRRIDKKDYQYTGALFESIKNGQGEEGTAVVGFNNQKEANIARYNEKRDNKDVFKPSEQEIEETKALMAQYVREQMQLKIKTIFV